MEALVFVDITSSMYLQLGSEVIIYIRISECKKKCNIQDYERGERYPGMTNRNKMQREGVRESARERERVREIRDRQTDRHVLTCTTSLCKSLTYPRP